jgi:type II secretory pathway pseudopilin PulG
MSRQQGDSPIRVMTTLPVHIANSRGVTYLALMFSIVLIGISASATARQWTVMIQREKEADLVAKGIEIQNALSVYSATMKLGRVTNMEVYPQSLAELTRGPKPYLRKVYQDPMNGGDWEYMRAPTGGVMGVRSKSNIRPIKERDFPLAVRHFEGRKSYRDWIFQHPNASSFSTLMPPMMGMPLGGVPLQPGQPGVAPGTPQPGAAVAPGPPRNP